MFSYGPVNQNVLIPQIHLANFLFSPTLANIMLVTKLILSNTYKRNPVVSNAIMSDATIGNSASSNTTRPHKTKASCFSNVQAMPKSGSPKSLLEGIRSRVDSWGFAKASESILKINHKQCGRYLLGGGQEQNEGQR